MPGTIVIQPTFVDLFSANGIHAFEDFMALEGEIAKENRYRRVIRFELEANGKPHAFYAKIHTAPKASPNFQRLARGRTPITPAEHEWSIAVALTELGIGTFQPVAWGEADKGTLSRPSFFITEELTGADRVEDFIPQAFSGPLSRADRERKHQLIRALADLARRFHGAGFFHRDFYLGHILVREPEPGRFNLFLIDLQRAEQQSHPRNRWFIKDIAQAAYTAPNQQISATDQIRFFRAYRDVDRLGPSDRRFARRVQRRVNAMIRRFERKGPIREGR